ncbi:MAG: hypothetical protein EP306_08770 [Burkholderiales bacterium]|nr:MAG: hypothetical protein EP306_08770 [Burkholderiales bacterium]
MALAPDLVQLLPLLAWSVAGEGRLPMLLAYSLAAPGEVLPLPPWVQALTHHLHCVMHSALVAGAVTAVLALWLRRLWIPLLGWWSHVLIDVLTHSAEFFPSPVFYPLTYWGFDGLAWNTPWVMVPNYLLLGLTWWWVLRRR